MPALPSTLERVLAVAVQGAATDPRLRNTAATLQQCVRCRRRAPRALSCFLCSLLRPSPVFPLPFVCVLFAWQIPDLVLATSDPRACFAAAARLSHECGTLSRTLLERAPNDRQLRIQVCALLHLTAALRLAATPCALYLAPPRLAHIVYAITDVAGMLFL